MSELFTLFPTPVYRASVAGHRKFKQTIVPKLLDTFKDKVIPTLPIGADLLMSKFQIPEGKTLGNKLKKIEETWVQNGFQI